MDTQSAENDSLEDITSMMLSGTQRMQLSGSVNSRPLGIASSDIYLSFEPKSHSLAEEKRSDVIGSGNEEASAEDNGLYSTDMKTFGEKHCSIRGSLVQTASFHPRAPSEMHSTRLSVEQSPTLMENVTTSTSKIRICADIQSGINQTSYTTTFHLLPNELLTEIIHYTRLFDSLQIRQVNRNLSILVEKHMPRLLRRYFEDLLFPKEIIDLYFSRLGWKGVYREYCLKRWVNTGIPLDDRMRMRALWRHEESIKSGKTINLILTQCHQVHFAAERLLDGIGNVSILKGTALLESNSRASHQSFVKFREKIQCPYTGQEESANISIWRTFDGWMEAFRRFGTVDECRWSSTQCKEVPTSFSTPIDHESSPQTNPDAMSDFIPSEIEILNQMQQAFVVVFVVDMHNPLESSQLLNCLRRRPLNSRFVTLLVGLYDCRYKLMLSHDQMLNMAKRFNALYVAVEEQQQAPVLVPAIASNLFCESVHFDINVGSGLRKQKSCIIQ